MRISVFSVNAVLAAGLALSGCATGTTVTQSGEAANGVPTAPVNGGQRDLTPQEKKVIVDAITPSLRNAGAAKYRWAKFPTLATEDTVNYCAMVDARARRTDACGTSPIASSDDAHSSSDTAAS